MEFDFEEEYIKLHQFEMNMNRLNLITLIIELLGGLYIILNAWFIFLSVITLKFVILSLIIFNLLPLSSVYNFKFEHIVIHGIHETINYYPQISIF